MMPKFPVRVLYDHQIFDSQDVGGISQCFSMYAKEYADPSLGVVPFIGCKFSNNIHIRAVYPNKFTGIPSFPGATKLFCSLNRLVSQRMRRSVDLIHPTYYFPNDLPRNTDVPVVSTVHDMIPELMPGYFSHGNPHWVKKEYCGISDIVVCVSENTRNDLVRIYGLPRRKTRVVYHGIDLELVQRNVEPVQGLPSEYLLYVGKRSDYKNFGLLITAMKILKGRHATINLVCVGGGSFKEAEKTLINDVGLTGRVHQIVASDAQLRWVYRGAKAFVYPSLYEGFGIPILEAFAQGCPVVLSSSSCFPEVAAGAATYFDPKDPDSCADALERALTDNLNKLIDLGIARCKEFTWHRAAEKLAGVYQELVAGV